MSDKYSSFKKGDPLMLRRDPNAAHAPIAASSNLKDSYTLQTCCIGVLKNGDRSLKSIKYINVDRYDTFIIDNIETAMFITYDCGWKYKYLYTIISVIHPSLGKLLVVSRHKEHEISEIGIRNAIKEYFRSPVSKEFDDYSMLLEKSEHCKSKIDSLVARIAEYERKISSLRIDLEKDQLDIVKSKQLLIDRGEINER